MTERTVLDLPWTDCATAVRCGEAEHRIDWHRGQLVCADHDVDAELALRALGGPVSECVRLVVAWRDYRLEPHLLGALLAGTPGMLSRQTIPLFGPRPANAGKRGVFGEVEGLLRLDRPFRLKLAMATVGGICREQVMSRLMADDRLSLEALARNCLGACLRELAPAAHIAVGAGVEVAARSSEPLLFSRTGENGVSIMGRLPFDWMATFAAGLSTFGRAIVIDVGRDQAAGAGDPNAQVSIRTIPVSATGELGDPTTRLVPTDALLASAHVPTIEYEE